ncbi:hypothetical protein B4135_1258 [Caldibacillus debilis]|uniref:Uncharacterized protein n=1 Tax=Caldibacillus debilis TaxID=301148 RepID=A0A150MDI9_9BACI|nr:hypothetical protein B4135_1258 [Caldibacillus debilis]
MGTPAFRRDRKVAEKIFSACAGLRKVYKNSGVLSRDVPGFGRLSCWRRIWAA